MRCVTLAPLYRAAILDTDLDVIRLSLLNETQIIYIGPQITSLSASCHDDHLLIVHLRSGNDLVVSLQPDAGHSIVGEAIGILVQHCSK